MPRKLPWLTGNGAGASPAKDAPRKARAAQASRKRSSSPSELVNSDLEFIGDTPKRKPKKRSDRQPSSSPPPAKAAPVVEHMREGFTMDDRYMMVEDEFTSTARLFSLPLHQDEYERTKRRAKARGAETLKLIGHGTDGTTGQSRALRLHLEAEERAKKTKAAADAADDGSGDDEEDEFMADPQLAGLMTASQGTPRKSLKGFASNSQRTPRVADGRTRDAVGEGRVLKQPNITAIAEADETEDEDDLDAYAYAYAASPRPTADTYVKHASETVKRPVLTEPAKKRSTFKQFTNAAQVEREQREEQHVKSDSPTRRTVHRESVNKGGARKSSPTRRVLHETSVTSTHNKPVKMSRTAAILARRREAQQQTRPEIAPQEQIKEELQSQVRVKKEPISQTQDRTQVRREPPPVSQALASKFMVQRRAERAKKEAEEKQKSKIDDIPTFLY